MQICRHTNESDGIGNCSDFLQTHVNACFGVCVRLWVEIPDQTPTFNQRRWRLKLNPGVCICDTTCVCRTSLIPTECCNYGVYGDGATPAAVAACMISSPSDMAVSTTTSSECDVSSLTAAFTRTGSPSCANPF